MFNIGVVLTRRERKSISGVDDRLRRACPYKPNGLS